jgi:DNA-directed RNA polymerase specialized sigma subunit
MSETTGVKPTRQCTKCRFVSEDLTLFVKDGGSKYGRRNFCKKCSNTKNRENTETSKYKHKHQLAKRYGITPEEYVKCMETSKFCQVCGRDEELCYDHDHITMEFRGVLCRSCNKAIGALGDTAEGLLKAYKYLEN